MSDSREERMEALAEEREKERRFQIDLAGNFSSNNPNIDWEDEDDE
jgi:hypothetical protein